MTSAGSYRNPIVDEDRPDPDAIAFDGAYYLVTSSFGRAPGLPIFRSTDLVGWQAVGHALRCAPGLAEDVVEPGKGVWAPSMRAWDDRVRIYWGDPDRGIFCVSAAHPEGLWSEPELVIEGRGLIDPCPYLDESGRVWLVHGWAHSRAGIANRLDVVELDRSGIRAIGPSRVLIDGDLVEGCTVLEGPKLYRARDHVWLLAPAGGVATGWQYAFRARTLEGPWEHRIVLAQGSTDINGPHQGALLTDAAGDDWFLHFQDRGWAGRVLHLQPVRWSPDGWPVLGHDGEPVREHPRPAAMSEPAPPRSARGSTSFWAAAPAAQAVWSRSEPGGFGLVARASGSGDPREMPALRARPLRGDGERMQFSLALDTAGPARGGVAVVGVDAFAVEIERDRDGAVSLVAKEFAGAPGTARELSRLPLDEARADITITVDASGGTVAEAAGADPGRVWRTQARPGVWVGAVVGCYAVTDASPARPTAVLTVTGDDARALAPG